MSTNLSNFLCEHMILIQRIRKFQYKNTSKLDKMKFYQQWTFQMSKVTDAMSIVNKGRFI